MAVYEIKNPAPFPSPTIISAPNPLDRTEEVFPVTRVRHFRREWERKRSPREEGRPGGSVPRRERALKDMVQQVNENFETSEIPIHLVFHMGAEEYLLDVYDCSGTDVCTLVADKTIPFEDLPDLIKNLQEEAGLIVDTEL